MKVYIQQDNMDSEALWLIIERNDKPAETKFIMGVKREEDSAGNVAFPFLKDEIKSIKNACDKWLNSEKHWTREFILKEKIKGELSEINGQYNANSNPIIRDTVFGITHRIESFINHQI